MSLCIHYSIPCPGEIASPVVVCCAAVEGDVSEGSACSGGGAPSVFGSGACEDERLQRPCDLTGGRTVVGRSLSLELVADKKEKKPNQFL